MSKKIIYFGIFLMACFSFKAQQWDWAEGFNTIDNTIIKVDKEGNTFAIITYKDSIDEKNPVTQYGDSLYHMLIKRDKNNNFLWSKTFYCKGQSLFQIIFNKKNEIFLSGYFSDKLNTPDFNLTSNGNFDITLIKIGTTGIFSLITQIGGTGSERGDCAFDSRGFLIVTGGYKYSGTFDTLVYNGNSSEDFFLVVYDTLGNLQWSERAVAINYGIGSYCFGTGIKTDSLNNIYVGISGSGTLQKNGAKVGMWYGINLSKFNNTGTFIKEYDIGSGYWSQVAGYDIDNSGNIYYANASESAHTSFESNVVKKDSSNTIVWYKHYGIGGYATPGFRITGFYFDHYGSYYFTGSNDSLPGIQEFISKGDAKTGNILWTYNEKVGGSYIAQDSENAIYIAGNFRGIRTIGGNTITSLNPNYYSPYVVKLSSVKINIDILPSQKLEIIIYPNPSSEKFIVSSSKEITSIATYNSLGEKVYSHNNAFTQLRIDLSNQPKGIYFVEIVANEKRTVKKIVLD